ncbi:hypothetical protein B296_00046942, partial [Ensete ventricosum]
MIGGPPISSIEEPVDRSVSKVRGQTEGRPGIPSTRSPKSEGMASQMPIATSLLILLLLILGGAAASSPSGEDLVAELETLRSQSPSGFIHLDDRLVSRFLTSAATPRPYSLFIFFDAAQLRSKPELHLPHLHSDTHRLFFCDIEFGESQNSFALFGVSSLPHARLVPASALSLRDDSIP